PTSQALLYRIQEVGKVLIRLVIRRKKKGQEALLNDVCESPRVRNQIPPTNHLLRCIGTSIDGGHAKLNILERFRLKPHFPPPLYMLWVLGKHLGGLVEPKHIKAFDVK